MLDISHETKLSEQVWKSLPIRAVLPCPIEEFPDAPTASLAIFDSKRLHNRRPLRTIAIVLLGEERFACFTKDVSRMGVGFYSPVNLLPKKIVTFWLSGDKMLPLSITRCRRLVGQRHFDLIVSRKCLDIKGF